jgi:hypothetical protein
MLEAWAPRRDHALALGYIEGVDGIVMSNLSSVCAVLCRLVT